MYQMRQKGAIVLTNAQKKRVADIFLFSGLDDPALVAALADVRLEIATFAPGQTVCDAEHFTPSICVILRGTVTVLTLAGGNAVPLRTLTCGEVFGAASLFGAERFPTEIVSKTETTICRMPQAMVEELISTYPALAMRYITFLSDRIRFLNRKIHRFTAGSVEAKVATYLLSEDVKQGVSLTRLASALDIGRASLYRVLGSLEARGMIKKEGKEIRICDLAALQGVADVK